MMNENLGTFTTCTRKKDRTKRKKAMHIWVIYIKSPPASLDCYRNEKCEIPKRSTKFLQQRFSPSGLSVQKRAQIHKSISCIYPVHLPTTVKVPITELLVRYLETQSAHLQLHQFQVTDIPPRNIKATLSDKHNCTVKTITP
jgi:hypothetical protein